MKASTAHLKAEIKEFDAESGKLAKEVDDSACYKDVPCERRFIYRTGKVEEVRLDTKEMISERALEADERQLDLPKAKKPKLPSQDETTRASGETKPAEDETKAPDSETPPEPDDEDDDEDDDDEATGDDVEQTGDQPAE